jgi:hypothetical protein
MATVDQTMMKVQRLLGSLGLGAELSGNRLLIRFRDASTMIGIKVLDWGATTDGDPRTLVTITAPVLLRVKATPKLFEWVAKEGGNYFFGHLAVMDDDDKSGTVYVEMRHTLLGDYLDEQELADALYGVVGNADQLDDEMQKKFGGERLLED